MVSIINYLTSGIIATGILAAIFSTSSGLSCYQCVYSDDVAYGTAFGNQIEATFTQSCQKPVDELAPVKLCNATQLSCSNVSVTLTASGQPIKLLIRECHEGSVSGNECQRVPGSQPKARFLEILENARKSAKDSTASVEGAGCLCDSEKCNSEPGVPGDPGAPGGSGLSCYACVYSDHPEEAAKTETEFKVQYTSKCFKPEEENAPLERCNATELSCSTNSYTVTAQIQAQTVSLKYLFRKCLNGPVQADACKDFTEADIHKRSLEIMEKAKKSVKAGEGDTVKIHGTACGCGSEKCNKNPGVPGDPGASAGLGKANHIQTSLPVNAFAIGCLSLYYPSRST